MPKNTKIKSIAVIGSGPIKIGQAAEFDYAGTQACLSLKAAGYHVILINSNPATIMTDTTTADEVYLNPLTVASVTDVLTKTHPDALLPTLGGQTGLNLAMALDEAGVLTDLHIQLLGTSLKTINQAEDRAAFKALMAQLQQPIPASTTVHHVASALTFAERIGYPVIVRPAFTLGGSGGGIAHNPAELTTILQRGLTMSPVTECLIEQSIAGYKEIEFEVMRDNVGNEIIVCSMENFDPVGIHTGDSIVYAPVQTLSDPEYQTLRQAALTIVAALNIKGGCNVQLAQDPHSSQYYVIEVNPRVSRSSALASKATGYPIAKIAADIAIGLNLSEIKNPVTQTTYAAFEPALDYVVAKIPRFAFDKFPTADAQLGTQMKATGEVMAIGTTIEEATLKAVASLETTASELINLVPDQPLTTAAITAELTHATDQRLFYLIAALQQGWPLAKLADLTQIAPFFLRKLQHIVEMTQALQQAPTVSNVLTAAKYGLSTATIQHYSQLPAATLTDWLADQPLVYKMVDTCAGEFASVTPYFYSTAFGQTNESQPLGHSIIVLGSGPIRIGQGIEFDYTTVHCVKAIQQAGYHAIVVNNNPETVSTDFSSSDKLYFEPLTLARLLPIINLEQPLGVIVQFGGQTAINLAKQLADAGVTILGTSVAATDLTENRQSFADLLAAHHIKQATGTTVTDLAGAKRAAAQIGYPLLVRPSFVLGGRAMAIVHQASELTPIIKSAVAAGHGAPILMDQYLAGQECEVDVLSDGEHACIPGIMEHIEGAGVHSGDSMAVYPPQHLAPAVQTKIIQIATELAHASKAVGMLNIQFVVTDDVYVIDVNPRASRTVPFMSKVTHLPLAQLATQLILGKTLAAVHLPTGLYPATGTVAIKAPVFSFNKLPGMPTHLSPEMKSTGETMGSGPDFSTAWHLAMADSYQLQAWQASDGIITDEATWQLSTVHNWLVQTGIPITVATDMSQLPASSSAVVFTMNPAPDAPLVTWSLNHEMPLLTALDTLKALVEVTPQLSTANL
ncbi:carbamoyl-phosphate synthase large subunit [Lactiplantibacillus fabifermentans]|uniref:Carbamoyl phosphate synthase large subunit n=2 Tax=Lactiplantibacillus fabifermentans TaxID=483011 RepID=A0A0R2NSQ4_9LACO|nr:carbamoyl-phosphate synthase large subunit [Lactiplantibacillus fabifermentans]ETY75343.1 carbamoyl phosphate synthase large subunit [Lactiplantibacillus fabifermentans T30PCM01]KRO28694.1 carbamoyl phosphate synthase large subunit [Lactiplantibacillus fabifermentans DSM 21115]